MLFAALLRGLATRIHRCSEGNMLRLREEFSEPMSIKMSAKTRLPALTSILQGLR
jgi:hypothetical protein